MCQAIYQPVGVTIGKEQLRNSWDNNPDGGGYAFIDSEGEITIRKFMEKEVFIASYHEDRNLNPRTPFVIHTRIGTSGTMDLYNVHPFRVDEHTVMIHNGMLSVHLTDKMRSDTRTFVEDYLSQFPSDWLDNHVYCDLVDEFSKGSKLVFLTTNPALKHNVYIFHNKSGTWDRGAWWSNTSHRRKKNIYNYSSSKGKPKWNGGKVTGGKVNNLTPKDPPASSIPGTSDIQGTLIPVDDDWDYMADFPPGIEMSHVCRLCKGTITMFRSICLDCEWCAICDHWDCDHFSENGVVAAFLEYWEAAGWDHLLPSQA